MKWVIYNILFLIGYILMLPRFITRMRKRGGYGRGFMQRFGIYPAELAGKLAGKRRIWIHAVSVGELFVAFRFIREFRAARPDACFLVSTNTSTGYRLAGDRLCGDDLLVYFPVDLPFIVKRVIRLARPEAIIMTEGELWPNFIRFAKQDDVPVFLVNGRVSEGSFKWYRRLGFFFAPVLQCFDMIIAQSDSDAARYVGIGADAGNVAVAGSIKYDLTTCGPGSGNKAAAILREGGIVTGRRILLGGSTWPGEEAMLLDVFQRLSNVYRDLLLVIVPRHAERREEVRQEITRRGLRLACRTPAGTELPGGDGRTQVLLVATTGELLGLYGCADVIFVGKSLYSTGGQNIIEPASMGKPVVVGPHMENFRQVMDDFLAEKAVIQSADAAGVEEAIKSLFADDGMRTGYGERAAMVVSRKSGATARSTALILKVLASRR